MSVGDEFWSKTALSALVQEKLLNPAAFTEGLKVLKIQKVLLNLMNNMYQEFCLGEVKMYDTDWPIAEENHFAFK